MARKSPSVNGKRQKAKTASIVETPDLQGMSYTCASELRNRQVKWLWRNAVPLGGLVFMDGDPGRGKSTICYDLISRVTTGKVMPDRTKGLPGPAGAIYITTEDDPETTIVPRLIAAGADMNRVIVPRQRDAAGKRLMMPLLPAMVMQLAKIIQRLEVKIAVLDPWEGLLPSELSPYKAPDVRRALGPLSDMAWDLECGIICIRHPTKDQSAKAIYRGGGSVAVSGVARVVLAVEQHRKEEGVNVLIGVKNNLGPELLPLGYVFKPKGEQVIISWQGKVDQKAGDPVRQAEEKAKITLHREAMLLIREVLEDGPKPAKDVLKEGEKAGMSTTTMHNARVELGVDSKRKHGGDGFFQMWIPPEVWPEEK